MASIETTGCGMYDEEQGCPLHGETCAPPARPEAGLLGSEEASGPAVWACGRAHSWATPCDECAEISGHAQRMRDAAAEREEREAAERAEREGKHWRVAVAGTATNADRIRAKIGGDEAVVGADVYEALEWIVNLARVADGERREYGGAGWMTLTVEEVA